MSEYGFSLTHISQCKHRIGDSVVIREVRAKENMYSRLFYTVCDENPYDHGRSNREWYIGKLSLIVTLRIS